MPKLFLIAGHGAGDPGACGNGYQEAERVRALAKRIKELAPDQVILGDFGRNYYADGGINSLNVDKDTMVVELHMDSAGATAKGAHVIIKDGYSPDWFDKALADKLTAYLPGRSNSIVGRSNLANVNRAANRGINYRLVENGFISNAGDVAKFNDLDKMARIYLEAAGISTNEKAPEAYVPRNVVTAKDPSNSDNQLWWIRGRIGDGEAVAIRNAANGLWLSDPNSSTTPTNAQTWGGTGEPGKDDPRSPQWLILKEVDGKPGIYHIHPQCAPALALDVYYGKTDAETQVQWWGANNTSPQEWVLYQNANGKYRIINMAACRPIAVV